MATVFMKWLETSPQDYDRGIQMLTLGRLRPLMECIADQVMLSAGHRNPSVLEIGCGTGTLAIMMAKRGAQVTAIDISSAMLAEAEWKAERAGVEEAISFHQLDVTELAGRFEPSSFDAIVSTLVFSELPPEVERYALQEAARLLKPDGRLLIADEMVPAGFLARIGYWSVRLPLLILTWLLTRTTTRPLRNASHILAEAGFVPAVSKSFLGGSLQLISARWSAAAQEARRLWGEVPQLRRQVTLKTFLLDLWSSANRMVPPYAKVQTGLYRIGHPDRSSPVLVTGNYHLTVRRLVQALDGRAACWLVVANSRGINVWCAAGGGHFTAGDVISALRTSGVTEAVDHHALLLPQLCANGVDGWRIRKETGWGVHWGPVRAADIPSYLAHGRKKSETMRRVQFPLGDRVEMTAVMLLFYGPLLALLGVIFWRQHTWAILGITALISSTYGLFLPWLPGRDGLGKGATLSALTLLGLGMWSLGWGHLPAAELFNWALGLGFLAFFVGAEFQGMSPHMRGEQANWLIEGLVGLVTLVAYGAGRLLVGV